MVIRLRHSTTELGSLAPLPGRSVKGQILSKVAWPGRGGKVPKPAVGATGEAWRFKSQILARTHVHADSGAAHAIGRSHVERGEPGPSRIAAHFGAGGRGAERESTVGEIGKPLALLRRGCSSAAPRHAADPDFQNVVQAIANGIREAVNSLVQAVKAEARGYRSTRNLKAIITI
jgi:transposase